jgi:hypothetical protein
VIGFDLAKLDHELVELVIADDWIVQDVIAVVVIMNFPAEMIKLLF